MQLAVNTVVAGRFRLNHLIGRGGMGSVWHATHLGLDIPCALKFIEGEMAQVPDAQARFEREAKAAAQLRSPNVVQILDHGLCEGTPYIAMELLDGEDFGKRLSRVQRMAPLELHAVVNQVCRALSKAHALGIVHRDLKPDNIFIVRDDDREIAKVLDFGIAKSASQQLGVSSATKTGAMLGTPYYMSPEQAQGTKQVDGRSDLWALAVICFRALTGKLPFTSEALGDLLMKIIIGPIPVPSQYAPVPDGFDRWWVKATAREPAERFQTAKDFADSLALVCGVSQVSGIIDRAHMRVVAHQTSGGTAPSHASNYGEPSGYGAPPTSPGQVSPGQTRPGETGAGQTGAPYPGQASYGQTGAPPTDPMPSPNMGQTPGGAARGFHMTGGSAAGLPPVMGGPVAPMSAASGPVPQFGQTAGSATPATFGESVAGVAPKKANLGIVIGVGAAVAVCLILGVGVFVWRSTGGGAAHEERTTAGVGTASALPAASPTVGAAGPSTITSPPSSSSATPSPPPADTAAPSVATEPQVAVLPAPVPPSTSSADAPPIPPHASAADTPKSAGSPPAGETAAPKSTSQHSSHPSAAGKKKHEDLGF